MKRYAIPSFRLVGAVFLLGLEGIIGVSHAGIGSFQSPADSEGTGLPRRRNFVNRSQDQLIWLLFMLCIHIYILVVFAPRFVAHSL